MNKILLPIGLFLIFYLQGNGQSLPKSQWKLLDADVLGFVYLSDGEQLIKAGLDGRQLANYQDSYLGDIQQIDCFKGLKNLVFHIDANTIVLLDNQLAPLGDPLDLTSAGYFDVAAACLGPDDRIWIADGQTGQLLLISSSVEVVQQGAIYHQYTDVPEIEKMVWRNNQLIMITKSNELLVFDQFGTFSNKYSFNQINKPYINYQHVFFLAGNHVLQFNYSLAQTDTIKQVNNAVDAVWQSKNQVYLLEKNRIEPLNN